MKQKQDLIAGNLRTTSYDLNQPLVDSRPRATADVSNGLIGNEASRPANGLFVGAKPTGGVNTTFSPAAMNRSTSFGGLLGQQPSRPANGLFQPQSHNAIGGGLPTSGSMPMYGMNVGGQGYFASPTAGMAYSGYGAPPSMMGYPAMPQYQQQAVNPSAYYALTGGYGYQQPQQQQVFPSQPAMTANMNGTAFTNPAQASSIERWRQNIAPA